VQVWILNKGEDMKKYILPIILILCLIFSVYCFAMSIDSESFETNFGDWENIAGNDEDWQRITGATPTSSTGASSAQDGSYYIYVETSSGSADDSGDESIIELDIGSTISGKVDFYYHQYGTDQGVISLLGWNGSTWVSIWSSSGDQENQWNHQVSSFEDYSKLRFKNVADGGFRGDICLDNIVVSDFATSVTGNAIMFGINF
jgi:hypothetical protein